MGIEFELKFRTTPEKLVQILGDVPGEAAEFAMQTTYYDTPEKALSQRFYTLRQRMENEMSVCTLKTPAGGVARNETEVFCDTIERAIPELCKLSEIPELPALLEKGVVPVCGARFTRKAKTVVLSGATVELACDQGVLIGGGQEIPLCEVEVELKSGSRDAALMYAAQLSIAYGLEQEKRSKFHRAKMLAEGEYHG